MKDLPDMCPTLQMTLVRIAVLRRIAAQSLRCMCCLSS